MGDNNWNFNRLGRVAPVSNPGSSVPNYGLTYDVATAPYDDPDQFDQLAQGLQTYMEQKSGSLFAGVSTSTSTTADDSNGSLWDHIKSGASAVGGVVAGGYGATVAAGNSVDAFLGLETDQLPDWLTTGSADTEAAIDDAGLTGWEKYKALGAANAGASMSDISKTPGVEQIFWGLDQLNEYASTAFVAGSLAEDDAALFFKAGTWGDAHALTEQRHLNAGEAFAQMFYDKEVIQDADRFEQIRQHNTVFNLGALTFNVVAAWKLDPGVIFGKGVGAARDLSVGKLSTNARTAAVQRDVLSAPDLETAQATAGTYTSLADKLRATHAISLYDRAQQLRVAAQNMGFEDFKSLPAFSHSASGTTLAKLMQDVSTDDDAWNLVFRSALGDPEAVGQLIGRQGEVTDKIAAIEMKTMPRLQEDLTRMETRYNKRLAEQGRPQDARIEITRFGDKWLDDTVQDLRAEADVLNAHLGTYRGHESWLQRALPGLDQETGLLDSNAPNSIFGNLDRLGGQGSLRRLGGDVKMWRHDDYSPMSVAYRAPTKPFLKRVGVVSLNDVDEGATTITSYLDQLDFIRGGTSQAARDNVLSAFAGATTDVERKVVVERLEREAITALGQKYGLSTEIMDRLGRELQNKRQQTWFKFSDNTIYSPIPGKDGPGYATVADDAGNMKRIKMPVDPTQLSNWHPLTNLTDLDRTIRRNADTLRSMDKELASLTKAKMAWTERHAADFVDYVGSWFNSFWKPLALLSIRWPARVVADESIRVMLLAGVLPHMAAWTKSAGHVIHNQGIVRPYEWYNGRKIKTGSLSEESLRSGARNDFDAYDYRAITNPTAAMPLDEIDFGKIDTRRYDKLNATTAERGRYLRSLEAHRANTREAKKVSPEMGDAVAAFTSPERPRWATEWDERLKAAESSSERGFFFDPVTRKSVNKGFAVSAYPGRLRTFERKPTARELNYWTEKNSDLLAITNNRAAVWLDKDTGRWHLDVVKTTKRREDAMLLAGRTEATEFYDIEDGFTRFMSEDYWNHFTSPLVKDLPEGPGGVAFDQAPLSSQADQIGAAIGGGTEGNAPIRKATGFGTKKWRTRDGRTVEGEAVFGPDTKNPNIYHSVVSSRDAMRNLYGGYTKGLGMDRASRSSSDYKYFDPSDPDVDPKDWAKAYAYFVNNHIKYSPFWERMLEGQSDDQVYNWLMSTSEGRAARKRVPVRGANPDQWIADSRAIFEHMFPNERALEAARIGDLTPEQALDLIPADTRPFIAGDAIKLGLGTSEHLKLFAKVVDSTMNYLATVPTDALVRHPFAQTVYNREMRNYLASVPAHKVTNNVLAAAEASSRGKAVREVRRTLYNIADEREGVHMLRFISPFYQAQLEVLERYARISMEKPESVARIAMLLSGSQTLRTGLWEVRDREGKLATGYSGDNQVIFQVGPTLRGLVDHIPGLKGALDNAGDLAVSVSSLNLIFQGDVPFLPSLGPLVTMLASEFYFKDRPQSEGSAIYNWLYPFGQPRGGDISSRTASALLPAWMRRATTGFGEDFDDPAFARRVSEIGAQQLLAWETGGREGPRPTAQEALDAAKHEYNLRAASSFFLPAPLTPRSPMQYWIDQYRIYKEKYGEDQDYGPDERFYDDYGPEFFAFAQQATESSGGMGPNVGEKKAYDRYSSLIAQAPDMIGVLTGPFATDEFSDSVYQWQLNTPVSPGSTEMLRERLSPAERIANTEVDRGWVEYGKLSSAIDAEIRNRVAAGGSAYLTAGTNADLKAVRDAKIREIIERNPAWNDAYTSRTSELGTWLSQAYSVSFDESLDGRTDIEALRAYLIGRARLQDALRQRQDSGLSSSDQLSYDPLGNPIGDNADLATAWTSWVNEAKAQNPLFAEIYNRYLEGDDLSTYISPEVSDGIR